MLQWLFNKNPSGAPAPEKPASSDMSPPASADHPNTLARAIEIASQHHNARRFSEAEAGYRQILAVDAKNFDALQLLGALYNETGHNEQAVELISRAIDLDPSYPPAHYNLAIAYGALNRIEPAIACYRKAIALEPGYFEAHYNLAVLFHNQGRLDEALASYKLAISLNPNFAEAHNNEGVAHGERGQINEAILAFQRALSIKPDYAAAQYNLGNALVEPDEALACYQKALSLEPEYVEARWACTIAKIPAICAADVDPKQFRGGFAAELEELASWIDSDSNRIARAYKAVGAHPPFYLAYQEENNKELLSRNGELCVRIMRAWQDGQKLSPFVARNRKKIAVGIVSAHICEHSVWNAIIKGWLLQFDRSRFDLHLFHVGMAQDQQTLFAQSRASSFEQGKRELPQWANAIFSKQLDVLLYPEIGMDAMTVKLASLRLAPIQVTTWGHPETSGLPTMDYFLSAEDFEPAGGQEEQRRQGEQAAQEYYTEQLVTLPHLGCFYSPLPVAASDPKLATLGIDLDSPLLLCPGIAYKYLPQHDGALVEIARRLGDCQIIFVVTYGRECMSEMLRRRLEIVFTRSGLDFGKFVVFIPWQKQAEFYGLMQQVDVYLDTIGFSGFNTAMQAIECGLPIVTREGRFMRGRLASGILKRMGLPELIAESEEDYISLAVKLARDSEYRSLVRKRIEANRHILFNDTAPIRALETFLIDATHRQAA
jgi:protein O-GlcNAc transferase